MAHKSAHGSNLREMSPESLSALDGHGDPGKFGRMFPALPPLIVPDDKLTALADAMRDPTPGDPGGDNPMIPAGFTYLGQFVDHDITLDTTPLAQQKADPQATENFRSPALDLDSLYGQGPGISPELHARDPVNFSMLPEMLIGNAGASADGTGAAIPEMPNDLPRNRVGRALIADERNDENLLVAQTHLLFLKFHNAVVSHLRAKNASLKGDALYEEARRVVTWHYQWIVLFDFVERLAGQGTIHRIRQAGRKFYRFKKRPYMPVEFAAAAYRLGHSMVREAYSHNRVFRGGNDPEVIAPATLGLLFHFTGKSGGIVGDVVNAPNVGTFPPPSPGPFRDLPSNWVTDWRRLFDLGTPPTLPGFRLNPSRRLDPFLVPALHTLPGGGGSLPFRNLKRGVMLGLPSGQAVANAMRVQPLDAAQLTSGPDGAVLQQQGLHEATPLWYYILKEAEQFHQGLRLGPVGSTLVAETFLGLVHGDPGSFMAQRPNWQPELPSATPGTFTMTDLIRFVNDINPVG